MEERNNGRRTPSKAVAPNSSRETNYQSGNDTFFSGIPTCETIEEGLKSFDDLKDKKKVQTFNRK
jgi:hypothetical protein